MLAAACLWPPVSPAVALAAGVSFSLVLDNPLPLWSRTWCRRLLQTSVIGLGFGAALPQVLREGSASAVYTIASISLIMAAGWWIGHQLRLERRTALLTSFGTAICGGSAIAALAPVLKAESDETAVSLATVFILNAAALLLFPQIGHLLNMKQHTFGVWSALAIHDTSSVVGAAAAYGQEALEVAVIVKLVRTIWVIPCVLGLGWLLNSGRKVTLPLFILGFIAAATIRWLWPDGESAWDALYAGARRLLTATLFLVGAGLSRPALRRIGLRPLLHGLLLWALTAVGTLGAILSGWIPT